MGTRVVFTPLSGADAASPPAYLLEVNGFTFLLDAGWDERFDPAALEALRNAALRVDAVLISHPDIAHLGALPVLVGRFGLQAPIYATMPVHRMGQLALREACLSRAAESDFTAFSLADVDAAFGTITQLRWRQTVSLTGKGEGLSITPYAAGRLVGGSVWRISFQGEDFVYAVDINHRKERMLNGAALESIASRPALLITDAYNAQQMQPDVGNWEAQLMAQLKTALRADGKVLIAVDAAGRVLELLLALERAWGGDQQLPYPLALCSAVAKPAVENAKAQLPWLADRLQRSFEADRDNPFALKHVQLLQRLEDVERLGPAAVVLAPAPSLAAGPARALLTRWATDERNLIVIPGRPPAWSLAAEVVAQARARDVGGGGASLQYVQSRRVPLRGQELADYETAAAQDSQEDAAEAAPGSPAAAEAPLRQSTDTIAKAGGDGGGAPQGDAATSAEAEEPPDADAVATAPTRHEVLVEGFTVPQGAVAPMFPDEDEWEGVEWDEYGAALDLAAFAAHDAGGAEAMDVDGTDGEGQAAAADVERPTKVVTENIDLLLRAKVLHLAALEGRTDGRSQRTIIGHLAPRHLAIVRGSDEARGALAAHCRAELAAVRCAVHLPAAGQALDVSSGCASLSVALSPELAAGLKLRPVGEYHLGWVSGLVGPPPPEGGPAELLQALGGGAALSSGQGGVFIGDVRLSDLKRALTQAGMVSDWEGPGALVAAAGRVRVRLASSAAAVQPGAGGSAGAAATQGQAESKGANRVVNGNFGPGGGETAPENAALMLEGAMCAEYYAVRDLLYGQYHVC